MFQEILERQEKQVQKERLDPQVCQVFPVPQDHEVNADQQELSE